MHFHSANLQFSNKSLAWFSLSPSCLRCPPTGEELFPELQRVLHPHHAAVHEAGLRQDAHRLQWVRLLRVRVRLYLFFSHKFTCLTLWLGILTAQHNHSSSLEPEFMSIFVFSFSHRNKKKQMRSHPKLCLVCPSRLPVVQSGREGGLTWAPPVRPGTHQLPKLLEGGAAALPEQLSGQGDFHQRSECGRWRKRTCLTFKWFGLILAVGQMQRRKVRQIH